MFSQLPKVKEVFDLTATDISALISTEQPVILRGIAANWPAVKAGKSSEQCVADYLLSLAEPIPLMMGEIEPQHHGRLFYSEDFTDFNFERKPTDLSQFLSRIFSEKTQEQPSGLYIGSTNVKRLMPKFIDENPLTVATQFQPLTNIWLSNRTRVAAHHDVPNNIAVCVSGQRRFTLFPPEQIENLYIGPIDHTPAGQAISLVDFHQIDFDTFPKFKSALEHGLVAELEPGDALFIPSMWWHHVEGLENLNILLNYWWQETENFMGAPQDALLHALLNIKNLPKAQKQAWRAMFDYYIFNNDDKTLGHISEDQLGVLNTDSQQSARKIRAMLLNKLNR